MNLLVTFPLTVYYDASCALCRSEIETLKARDTMNALRLVDCSSPAFDGRAEAGLQVRDAILNVLLRCAGPGRHGRGRLFARIYASRMLRPLFDRLYPWVADHRQLLSGAGLWRVFAWVAPKPPTACSACAPRVDTIDSAKMPPIQNSRRDA